MVRTERSYQQGIDRKWSRRDLIDYYNPAFASAPEQPVYKKSFMRLVLRPMMTFSATRKLGMNIAILLIV